MRTLLKAEKQPFLGLQQSPVSVLPVTMRSSGPDYTEREHTHDFHELVFVLKGQGVHCLDGREYHVTRGDVFLIQGRQSHFFHHREGLELVNVLYRPDRVVLPDSELRKIPGYHAMFVLEPHYRRQHQFRSRLHLDPVELEAVRGMLSAMEAECRRREPGFEAQLTAHLLSLMVCLARAYATAETVEAKALIRVGRVLGALEDRPEQVWRVGTMARMAGMSVSHFMRVFRRATGRAPLDYLIRLRIQKAMQHLRENEQNVTEIAFATGFSDSNYFARQFRRVAHQSPREYRRMGRKHPCPGGFPCGQP